VLFDESSHVLIAHSIIPLGQFWIHPFFGSEKQGLADRLFTNAVKYPIWLKTEVKTIFLASLKPSKRTATSSLKRKEECELEHKKDWHLCYHEDLQESVDL